MASIVTQRHTRSTAGKAKASSDAVHFGTGIIVDENPGEIHESGMKELQLMHEELRLMHEGTPASNEELNSANQAQSGLNKELQSENTELGQLASELSDLLLGVNVPIVMLDSKLRVRRFTPSAGKVLHLTAADIGRPMSGLGPAIDVPDWEEMLSSMLDRSGIVGRELRDRDGHWHFLRLRPHKDGDSRTGISVALIDIDKMKRSLEENRAAFRHTEEALQDSQSNLALASTAAGFVMWDWKILSGRIHCTEECSRARGLPSRAGDLSREEWLASVWSEDRERVMRELDLALEGIKVYETEFRVEWPEGALHWVLEKGQLFRDAAGKPIRLLGVSMDITARRNVEEALRASEGQLRQLTTRLFATQEEERRRMARELHDDFNQRMALLANEVVTMEKELPFKSTDELRERVRSLHSQVKRLSDDLRQVAYQLHPPALEHFGLLAALESHRANFCKLHAVQVRFAHSRIPGDVRGETALCLFRIAQECLNNVASHSGATEASVKLVGMKRAIRLSIRDNGKGYVPELKGNGLGLISIRERVRALGGKVSVDPGSGRGVCVDVEVPWERKSE
jgi:two-component system, NarL family, sensor histidine kinase UhpB